ncbi:MAG: carboxypeptidase regulatory-like domain-containing protein [Acidobacteriota bacterium]
MNSLFRPARILCAVALALIAAAPLGAAVRKRPVLHPNAEKLTINGTVTDANTGLPLSGANVSSGIAGVITDAAGHYTLTCLKDTTVTASRVGYVTVQRQATGSPLDFALPQTATITVRTKSGQTFLLDHGSTKFGYVVVFSGYAAGDVPNVCRPGEPNWELAKADLKKITGPAHPLTSSCCTRGPVMAIDVELKNGEKTTAFLNDSCFGYEVDVLGVERSTAKAQYIHLTDVTEITFQ